MRVPKRPLALVALAAALPACGDFGHAPSPSAVAPDASIVARLPVGTHTIVLTVTDDDGLVSSDEAIVTVAPAPAPRDPFRVNYGVSGYSGKDGPTCTTECHLSPNGPAPALTLQGPTTLRPGETATYRLELDPTEPTDQQGGGLDVAVDGGTLLTIAGQQTQILNGELTHTFPRIGRDVIAWDYEWQAPSAPGTYRMFAASMSVNLTDRDAGDEMGTVSAYAITVRDGANLGPSAYAGPDRTLVDDDQDGVESVLLDGSGSGDADGTIVSWSWREGSGWSDVGDSCTVALPVGSHAITLEVADDGDSRAVDDVVVIVAPAGSRPPLADAGPDRTIVDADGDGEEVVRLDGSASIDADGRIVSWEWTETGIPVVPDGGSPSGATPR